jgi:hypothetical protein
MKSALNPRVHKPRLRRRRPTDVVEAERSDLQHWRLEKSIVDLCAANQLEPLTNRHIDVLCNDGPTSVIFEAKACPPHDIAGPLRRAVVQLLEYRYLYRDSLKPSVRLCIVSERRPRGGCEWLVGYLEHLGIGLIWRNDGDDDLNCTDFTKELLGDLFPQVRAWEPRAIMWK